MNYYRHHIGDFDSDTAHLSWLEDCAYSRLLRVYYRTEKPIPADIGAACRLVRAASRPERAAVQQVLREFFELHEDGWHQARCDAELASARSRIESARANGRNGGRPQKPKWPNDLAEDETEPVSDFKSNGNPSGFDPVSESKPERKLSILHPPTTSSESLRLSSRDTRARAFLPDAEVAEFERRIQADYPPTANGCNWPAALHAAAVLVEDGQATWAELHAGVLRYGAQKRALGKLGTQFVMSPQSYFGAMPDERGARYWAQPWPIPAGKAEQRLAENVATLQDFVASGSAA